MPSTYAQAVAAGGTALTPPEGRHGWVGDPDGYPMHLVTRSSPRKPIGWRFIGLRVAEMNRSINFYRSEIGLVAEAEPATGDGVLFTRVRPTDEGSARLSIQCTIECTSSITAASPARSDGLLALSFVV